MTREIKFRAWLILQEEMLYESLFGAEKFGGRDCEIMQYTGLKDKNGFQEVYEGDIIDTYGNIKGNIYEMDAGEADFIIQGFGDKNWGATYKEAVGRGCTDTQ